MKHEDCFQMQLLLQKMFIRTNYIKADFNINGVTGNIMTVGPALMNLTKVTAIYWYQYISRNILRNIVWLYWEKLLRQARQ